VCSYFRGLVCYLKKHATCDYFGEMYIFAGGEGALIAAGGSIIGTAEIH
jgi:hypothetical protein